MLGCWVDHPIDQASDGPRALKIVYFYFCRIFANNFARNYEKKCLEHQMLGR